MIPPAQKVHAKHLSTPKLIVTSTRGTLDIWPNYAIAFPISRRTALGIEAVLLNKPTAIRHIMSTHAANYVRPNLLA